MCEISGFSRKMKPLALKISFSNTISPKATFSTLFHVKSFPWQLQWLNKRNYSEFRKLSTPLYSFLLLSLKQTHKVRHGRWIFNFKASTGNFAVDWQMRKNLGKISTIFNDQIRIMDRPGFKCTGLFCWNLIQRFAQRKIWISCLLFD